MKLYVRHQKAISFTINAYAGVQVMLVWCIRFLSSGASSRWLTPRLPRAIETASTISVLAASESQYLTCIVFSS